MPPDLSATALSALLRAFCSLYVLRLHVACALARFLVTTRPVCASALFVYTLSDSAPAGASAWDCCPFVALLFLAGVRLRLLGSVVSYKTLSSRLLTAGIVIVQPV